MGPACQGEPILEEDVDLLLSLDPEGCQGEQVNALVQVLRGPTPWATLGVQELAEEPECLRSYKGLSVLIHPDKCPHSRSGEAFQKLGVALDWAKDKEGWANRQGEARAQAWHQLLLKSWLAQGCGLRRWAVEEELDRQLGEVGQWCEWIEMAEEWEWESLTLQWRQTQKESTPRYAARVRTQTRWYQSQEEELRDKERRREARGKPTRQSDDTAEDMEEESHDWMEGLERPRTLDQSMVTITTTHPGTTTQG